LLKNNKIREARRLLNTLRSEISIKVINLPLASYPAALKLAAKFLHENRLDEAKNVLNQALLTFVETEIITPIPLLKTEFLITEAEALAKKDNKKALEYLKEAKFNLKNEALGCMSESDTTYKNLEESIEGLGNYAKKLQKKMSLDDYKKRGCKNCTYNK